MQYLKTTLFKRALELAAASLLVFLHACSSNPSRPHASATSAQLPEPPPTAYRPAFGQRPTLVSEEQLFQLPDEEIARFLSYFNDPSRQSRLPHKRLADYVESFVADFRYYRDTQTATESAKTFQGNCLSLAILMTAYARIAGIDVGYQLVSTNPVFQRQGDVVVVSDHVRSLLYDPTYSARPGVMVFRRPSIVVDYFPARGNRYRGNINEGEFIAMYYRNKAADAIIAADYAQAYWLLLTSLQHSGDNVHAISMLALLYDRAGYAEDAEQLYHFGRVRFKNKLRLLSNYHSFLLRHRRHQEAQEIKQEIGNHQDHNPYNWLAVANKALRENNLVYAKKLYQKVIDMAPYLHEGYSGLAQAHYRSGHRSAARKLYQQALEQSFDQQARSLYQAKLAAFTKHD